MVDDRDPGAVVIGTMLTGLGVVLLLDRTGTVLWSGRWSLWPVLLIGYGVARLVQSWRTAPRGLFPLALGLWWLAGEAGWLSIPTTWPLLLIVLGVGVVWHAMVRPSEPASPSEIRARRRESSPLMALGIIIAIVVATRVDTNRYAARGNSPDTTSMFSLMSHSRRTVNDTEPFKRGDIVTVMAGSDLDLRQARVAPGEAATVEVFVLMGGGVIRVPNGWTIEVRAVPVMGGVRDRRFVTTTLGEAPPTGAPPRLVINGFVIMGGLDIRS
jgi:cell wall-active antibiotic response 4TMS protein YvqF